MTFSIHDVVPVLDELARDRDRDLGLRERAERAGWSPMHFQHAFARRAGESAETYAARIRLELDTARVAALVERRD